MGKNAPERPAGPDFDPGGNYIGPIEQVRPGDILTFDRLAEYDAFMKAKHGMRTVRHWGFNENYVDSGARPFRLADKPDVSDAPPLEEPNPFDPPILPPEPSPPEKTQDQP